MYHDGTITAVDYTANDRFCLNGQRLVAVSGTYGANGTEYRTSFEEFSKIVSTGSAGTGPAKFTVYKKSGEIIEYGGPALDENEDSASSRIKRKVENGTDAEVRVWAMNKLSDTVGNYISFKYFHHTNSGDFGILRIDYTGNTSANITPYNSIDFIYADAPRKIISYAHGERYEQAKRLTNVKVFAGTTLFRDYRLAYRSDFQLDTLTECATESVCFAPTSFAWKYDENLTPTPAQLFGTSYLTAGVDSIYTGYSVVSSGDFNSDGRTDLYFMKVDDSGRKGASGTDKVWLGKEDGKFTEVDLLASGTAPEGYRIGTSGDFNGDGLTDLYLFRSDQKARKAATTDVDQVWLAKTNGCPTQAPQICFERLNMPASGAANGSLPTEYKIAATAEFNGDGRSDLYIFKVNDAGKSTGNALDYIMLSSGTGGFNRAEPTSGGITGAAYDGYDIVSSGEFNGDGLTDFYLMRVDAQGRKNSSSQDYAWFSTNSGGFTEVPLGANFVEGASSGTGSTPQSFKIASSGDFNGDGFTDLYLFKADDYGRSNGNGTDYIRFSKGNGTFDILRLQPDTGVDEQGITGMAYDAYNIVSSGDYNSDGLTDLYVMRSDTKSRKANNSADVIWFSKGDGQFTPVLLPVNNVVDRDEQAPDPEVDIQSAPIGYRVAISGDINGDGLTDLYLLKTDDFGKSNGNPYDYVFVGAGQGNQKELILAVTNGLGNKAEVEYKPLTDSAVYTKGAGAVYPVADVAGASYVISKVKADNGIGGQNTQTYTYEGLRTHQGGIGNLGFAKMTALDDATGIVSESYYSQDHAARTHGLLTRSKTIAPGNIVLEDKQVTWVAQTLSALDNAPRYFRKSTLSVTQKRDLNNADLGEVREEFTYDCPANPSLTNCFGLVTSLTVRTTLGSQSFIKTTTNTYNNFAADWILGRLIQASVTHSVTGVSPQPAAVTRTSSFEYDARGLLLSETIQPNGGLSHTKTYARDVTGGGTVGAVTSITEIWGTQYESTITDGVNTVRSRVTSYSYDTKFRYKLTETNTLGHSQSTEYDAVHGLPTKTTGPNGLDTLWTYDAFGQVTEETRADGTTTKTYRYKCDANTPCPANGSYVVVTVTTGAPLAAAYMDKLHRTIRKVSESLDGSLVAVDTEFDALGREQRVSEPYFDGGAPLWTTVTYDILGRPTLTLRPDSSTQSVVYNGLTQVSTNELGQTKTVVNDATGRMISSKDANTETVSYRYDAIGQMTAIIDPLGNMTTMTYDVRGN
ncbi:MAG: FG-GAP-like repeat-containing protein, partial [Hyphomicrobiales bacterium]|nr:FG-GAP-like repeat-containing protein [Hyphomicrobiales bacterium]